MRREYQGAAQAAVLTVALGGSSADLTITCDDLTGWPTGVSYPFYIVIDRGTSSEEKILCSSRTGNIISVYNVGGTSGRGADGTSITSHNANAVVEHVFTATDADEANAHVNATSGTVHGLPLNKVVTTDGSQTLTNKTISQAQVTNLVSDLDSKADLLVTLNNQTTSYSLVLSDVGKQITMNASSATTITIPTNASVAFPVGTVIGVLSLGTGLVTVTGASGVTVTPSSGTTLAQNEAATLVKRATNTWSFVRGGFPKAVVSSSTAASTSAVTVSGRNATVYRFTGTGSITMSQGGLVDVLCQGPGGLGSWGHGGAGGYVEKTDLYVPSGALLVYVGAGGAGYLVQGTATSSFFQGVVATGGGPGAQYSDRQPSGGACGGGSGPFAPSPGAVGAYGQGLIVVSTGVTRGGNGGWVNGGGGGGVNGDASGGTGGAGYNPGSNWGSPGTLGRGGGGASMTANTGNGGNIGSNGNSGLVLIRVYS